MYNINSHYENILSYAKSIIAQPTLTYLHPFGATQPENLEIVDNGGFGPLLFCYDQEPIIENFNDNLFHTSWQMVDDYGNVKPSILLNTERHSVAKNKILEKYRFVDCNYFFHAFAAADWLLNQGYVSYSLNCPQYGRYDNNLYDLVKQYQLPYDYIQECVTTLNSLKRKLNIDNSNEIRNDSQTLGALSYMIDSFLHVVTETCFWEEKTHLTEKIFKPIVAKQPFVLLGCANNLEYLRSYGFKTFDQFWDESYDTIEDPMHRLQAVVNIVENICAMSLNELYILQQKMSEILEHNYNWFYNQEFIDNCWKELKDNLKSAIAQLPPRISLETPLQPYLYNLYKNKEKKCPTDI